MCLWKQLMNSGKGYALMYSEGPGLTALVTVASYLQPFLCYCYLVSDTDEAASPDGF